MVLNNDEKKLLYWQLTVEGKDVMEIPDAGYEASAKSDKYNRFTTFVREFIERTVNGQDTGLGFFKSEKPFPAISEGSTHEKWWKQAMDLGSGKLSASFNLPTIEEPKKEDVTAVMNAFLPAYRAIKENFDRRPFWHWFTQHDQYTAERDSLKALRGIMMSLAQTHSGAIAGYLEKYCDELTGSGRNLDNRKELLAAMRNGTDLKLYDDYVEDLPLKPQIQDGLANELANEVKNQYADANMEALENDEIVFSPEDIKASDNALDTDDFKDFNELLNNDGDLEFSAPDGIAIADNFDSELEHRANDKEPVDDMKKERLNVKEVAENVHFNHTERIDDKKPLQIDAPSANL